MESMIEVKNLTMFYGTHKALDNVSFTVAKGEVLGLLGPNAAGKSTTIRILTCFIPPTSGTAVVGGYDVLDEPLKVKRQIGYLPEMVPLYPEMSVLDYLDFFAKVKGVKGSKKRKEEVYRVVELCWIGNVYKKLIGHLSRGYRQRVGLAQSLLGNPSVLIFDEPTRGLDPKQIIETRELIKSLGGEHTVILCSHILPEVSMVCGRVVIINEGRIVAVDTPGNLVGRLRDTDRLRLKARGPADVMSKALKESRLFTSIELVQDRDGEATFVLDYERGKDIAGDVSRIIVQKEWELLGIDKEIMSLEEIFLRITTREE